MITTGKLIRNYRKEKGLLIRQLAAFIDIDQAILSKIERGKRSPNRNLILKIENILNIKKDTLLLNYFSEKIYNEIKDEKIAYKILNQASQKVKWGNNKNNLIRETKRKVK